MKNTRFNIKILAYFLIFTLFIATGCNINANASEPKSVDQAQELRIGDKVTVKGYIVGEPASMYNLRTRNFRNDYAIALADSKNTTASRDTILVKLDSSFRDRFGLKSNPGFIGRSVKITGTRQSYYGGSGIKNVTSIEFISKDEMNKPPVVEEPKNEDPVIEPAPTPTPTVPHVVNGDIDATGYYERAQGKKGVALKKALNDIIDNHTELSYSKVWEGLRDTDQDPNNPNNVILLYTGRSQSKYDNGGGINQWNREHVWAKSHGDFGTRKGAGTDLHHIRPTDVTVNSSRGNKNFDEGGSRHREAPECFSDADSFEPRDEIKGDVARMLFYMATRYEGEHGEIDLEVSEYLNNTKSPFHGKLSTLLKWHRQDPVSQWEIDRNNKIFEHWQGNRNPFIDHPEWVEAIWN